MQGLAFEWDGKKETANRRKHNVGFPDASTVFGDPLSITIPDPDHAAAEERFVIIGMSKRAEAPGCRSYYEGSANSHNQRAPCDTT
jgi:uncharacterized DUF497 family protein